MSNTDEIITGIDVGSSAIRVTVGQKSKNESLRIIAVEEQSAQGINKGIINSIEDAVSSISTCMEKAERITGIPIERVWVGISGSHITSQTSKGVIAISRPNGEITEEDVERVIEAARAVSTPPNYEILHVIPKSFLVDNQANIKDPIGMVGIRLEVEAQIVQGLSSQIKNLTKCIYRTGVEVEDLVLSILAANEAVLSVRQKELGVVVVDIGATTTSLIVYEEGDILHTVNLPIGSDHITADIAIGLRINIDLAERLKIDYGYALPKDIGRKEEIDLSSIDPKETQKVSRRYVAEIIEARVEEIFNKVDQELAKIDRSGKLPAGVVLIGGGAKLPQIVEVAKRKLRLPASLGQLSNIKKSVIDKINDLSYLTSAGMVLWGEQFQPTANFNKESKIDFSKISKVFKKITKKVKKLIP
jgi:cell division protein FtsA